MSHPSTCPKCSQPVTVPEDLEDSASVRCPLCEAEFPLSEVPREPAGISGDAESTMSFLRTLEGGPGGESHSEDLPELVPVAAVADSADAEVGSEDDREREPAGGQRVADQAPPEHETPDAVKAVMPEPAYAGAEGPASDQASESGAMAPEEPIDVDEGDSAAVSAEDRPEEQRTAETAETAEAAVSAEGVETGPESGAEEDAGEGETEEPQAEGEPSEGEQAEEAAEGEAREEEAAEEETPPLDLDPLVRGPGEEEGFHLSELVVAGTGEPIGAVAAAMIVRQNLLRAISQEEAEAAEAATAEAEEAAAGGFDFSGFAVQDTTVEGGAAPVGMAARPRPKGKEKHPVRHMLEVVLGGAFGLFLGYYLLNLFGGSRFDFGEIYLPGVKHTYKHAPDWMPPWMLFGADETVADAADGEGASGKDKSGKQGDAASNRGTDDGRSKVDKPWPDIPPPDEANEASAKKSPKRKPGKKAKKKPDAKAQKEPEKIDLVGAPTYSAADLGAALKTVSESLSCPACKGEGQVTETKTEIVDGDGKKKEVAKEVTTPCEMCGGTGVAKLDEGLYAKFCDLGERLTFVAGSDEENQLGDRKRAARNLLEQLVADPTRPGGIGELAGGRLDDMARLSMGVMLAGKLGPLKQQGAWHVAEVTLAGSDKTVPLLSRGSLPAAEGDRVAVLGAIVDEPGRTLGGYQGSDPVAVIAASTVKIP